METGASHDDALRECALIALCVLYINDDAIIHYDQLDYSFFFSPLLTIVRSERKTGARSLIVK